MEGFSQYTQFVETRAFNVVMQKLCDKSHVLILGRPGDGKTTLAFQALKVLQENQQTHPLITDTSLFFEFPHDLISGDKLSVLFDDLFGIYTVDQNILSKFNNKSFVLQFLGLIGRGNYFIMTMRKDIFLQCQNRIPLEFFKKSITVDLTESCFSLLKEEKELLLKQIPNIRDSTIDDILKTSPIASLQVGFPQCVEFMKDHGLVDFNDIVKAPMRYLRDKFSYLKEECSDQFIALVIAFANQGHIDVSEIEILKRNVPKELESLTIRENELARALDAMKGTYFTYSRSGDKYKIAHESILDGLASTLWSDPLFKEWYINNCPERFLARLTFNEEDDFFLPMSCLTFLNERLLRTIETKSETTFDLVASLTIWNDVNVTEDFARKLKIKYNKALPLVHSSGLGLLVFAARQGRHFLVRSLMRGESNTKQLHEALCAAAEGSHHDTVNLFVTQHKELIDVDVMLSAIKGRNINIYRYFTNVTQINLHSTGKSKLCNFISGRGEMTVNILEEVCLSGNLELLEHVIVSRKLDLKQITESNPCLLEYAAYGGSIELVEYLLVNGAKTCPHLVWWAASSGSYEMVKHLLKLGCSLKDTQRASCGTSLTIQGLGIMGIACSGGNMDVVTYLFKTKPDLLTAKSNAGISAVHLSAFSRSVDLLRYLDSVTNITLRSEYDRTVLHYACQEGAIDMVKYLLDKHPDMLTIKDTTGQSPYLVAGFSGSVELVKFLISQGCDVMDKNSKGQTVLHIACDKGKLELAQYLVEKYPDMLTIRDKTGRSPYLFAGFSGSVELVKFLISRGCVVMDKDNYGHTVLHYACDKGKLELAQYLVEKYQDFLTIRDNTGHSPYLVAGFSGSVELVKFLISHGCDVMDKDSVGRTVLHYACDKGKLELAQYLVEHYPDMLTIRDKTGQSPYLVAGFSRSVELVKFLISRGYDVMDKDSEGSTVLHKACAIGKLKLAQYLVESCPDVLAIRDNTGRSPYLVAGFSGSVELVKFLISRGCDVMDKDSNGQTVLHVACDKGKLALAQYLVEKYPDMLTIRDKGGRSPYLVAGYSGSVELVKFLISRGCDVRNKDSDGWTVLHNACQEGKLELAQYLVENYSDMLTIRDKTGRSPYLVAGYSGSVELVSYLTSKGCDVMDKSSNRWTVLHNACKKGKLKLVQYLSENHSEMLTVRNKAGQSPFLVSVYSGSVELIKFLISRGCDVMDADSDGQTAFHIACDQGFINLQTYLLESHPDILTVRNIRGHLPKLHS